MNTEEIKGYRKKSEHISKDGVKSVVYLMDCMDFMNQIPEKSFDLAVVDPPYGIGIDGQKQCINFNNPKIK